ncbi:protease [Bryobacterales bacterium F-183]|nr:protease [Bryobacterales bacterium F-183]
MPKPEVMSPAGHWPQLRAAIEAGADAVYFGLQHFSARAKVGFTLAELPEVMRTLHRRGVKGYVTFNTLVFEHELKEAARTLTAISDSGADAIIVQDIGVAKVAHEIVPDLPLHGSTQMTITSAEGVSFAQDLGITRVVLARELSVEQIQAIRNKKNIELEVFVHGALCVSYSGQCFSSEAWGGRSANRGQCAQACRLSYDLIVDGREHALGDARYLLSPGDLFAIEQVPALAAAGVHSLKIEGRYKDEAYVALATAAYRKAVDSVPVSEVEKRNLQQAYSRGMGPYFLSGTDHQQVVQGRAPRHRGLYMGKVLQVDYKSILAEKSELKPGDGVVFDAADWRSPDEREEGARVYGVESVGKGQVRLTFANGALDPGRIRPGDWIWRTDDPQLVNAVKPLIAENRRKQPVHVVVTAVAGQPLKSVWNGQLVESDAALEVSKNQGLTAEQFKQQFERLGGTPYELGHLEATIEGSPFVPVSLMNQIRRRAVEILQENQAALPERRRAMFVAPTPPAAITEPESAQLHVLVRTTAQLEAALALRPTSITLDYLELYGLKPSVERIQEAGVVARVASPRVLKPAEQNVVHFLRKLGCSIVVRSAGLLQDLAGAEVPLIGDFSLNVTNSISASILFEKGILRITPSYDLNADQVRKLSIETHSSRIEAVMYQHLPVFHTEHCVFCRFLSTGTDYRNCGHPCEKHQVAVRDQKGRAHPVMADVGCRNTVFGAQAQEASRHFDSWHGAGIRHFRLEFVHETPDEVRSITRDFQQLLSGKITSAELARRWQKASPQGITEGSLFVPANYDLLPILQ